MVEEAIKEREKLSVESKKEVDVVWAVFDKDDADENATKIKRFGDAFEIAESNGIETAYSNESFELWLLLHLTDVDSDIALSRNTIYALLQEHIRNNEAYLTFEYEHGNANILPIIYSIGNQTHAIKRADLLFQKQGRKTPIEANPSTRVYVLVQELLKWITYFAFEPD